MEDETYFTMYDNAVRGMMASDDVTILRYIYLIDPLEFSRRSSKTKDNYIKWLEKQKMLVKDNQKYQIVHSILENHLL